MWVTDYAKYVRVSLQEIVRMCQDKELDSRMVDGEWAVSTNLLPVTSFPSVEISGVTANNSITITDVNAIKNVFQFKQTDEFLPNLVRYLIWILRENWHTDLSDFVDVDLDINLAADMKFVGTHTIFVKPDGYTLGSHSGGLQPRQSALSILASAFSRQISTHPRVLVLGDIGFGKSLLTKFISLCLAGESLDHIAFDEKKISLILPNIKLLENWSVELAKWPLQVNLMKYVIYRERKAANSQDPLLDFIKYEISNNEETKGFEKFVPQKLFEGQFTVFFDGLDEINQDRRDDLFQDITQFASRNRECHFVITSRNYAIDITRWDRNHFVAISLANLQLQQVEDFLINWGKLYEEYSGRNPRVMMMMEDLYYEIQAQPHLNILAKSPMMLAFLAILRTTTKQPLSVRRGRLYESLLGLIASKWENNKTFITSDRMGKLVACTLVNNVSQEDLLYIFAKIAYLAHLDSDYRDYEASSEEQENSSSDISLYKIISIINEEISSTEVNPVQAVEDLQNRIGIFVSGGKEDTVKFVNRTFQEYLAGRYLAQNQYDGKYIVRFPETLVDYLEEDFPKWRETYKYAIDYLSTNETGVRSAGMLVGSTVRTLFQKPEIVSTQQGIDTIIQVITTVVDNEFYSGRRLDFLDRDDQRQIRSFPNLLKDLIGKDIASLIQKSKLGRLLGILGDNRYGVSNSQNGLPEINWITINNGPYHYGSLENEHRFPPNEKPGGKKPLAEFSISKYLITNRQYQSFVDAEGYSQKHWWTPRGWRWLEDQQRTEPDNSNLSDETLLDNYPRVNISWHEAIAFCNWLSSSLGFPDGAIRLPTESEWEKAARGSHRRSIWPWGDDENIQGNFDELIGKTTAVGIFPETDSPYQCSDMSGNVIEWCLSLWRDDYTFEESNQVLEKGARVLRGGWYNSRLHSVRVAYRDKKEPEWNSRYCGFRVASSKLFEF